MLYKCRKLVASFILVLTVLTSNVEGWLTTDPPVGHIESNQSGDPAFGYFADRDVLLSTQNVVTIIYGTAHKGYSGLSQADANARVTSYTLEYWNDTNMNWLADAADTTPTWQTLFTYIMAPAGPNVIGFDCSGLGCDTGTEGDLIQGDTWNSPGGYYLIRLYIVDVNGNTNMMVSGVNKHALTGADAYMGENGDATLGVEDNEIIAILVNRVGSAPIPL